MQQDSVFKLKQEVQGGRFFEQFAFYRSTWENDG